MQGTHSAGKFPPTPPARDWVVLPDNGASTTCDFWQNTKAQHCRLWFELWVAPNNSILCGVESCNFGLTLGVGICRSHRIAKSGLLIWAAACFWLCKTATIAVSIVLLLALCDDSLHIVSNERLFFDYLFGSAFVFFPFSFWPCGGFPPHCIGFYVRQLRFWRCCFSFGFVFWLRTHKCTSYWILGFEWLPLW